MRRLDIAGGSITALTDCAPAPRPCAWSFPDADLAAHPAAARWLADGLFTTRFGVFLLRLDGRQVLVDAGMGPGPVAYFPGLSGRLPAVLQEADADVQTIDTVVYTHLHVDHVGWADAFPRARHIVYEREWQHWAQGEAAGLPHHVAAVTAHIAPLMQAGRLHLAADGEQVVPGLRLLAAPGHTPGHAALLAAGRVLISGDCWHNPAQIAMPAWCHRADADKQQAVATRRGIATLAQAEAWIVGAGHFTEAHAFGRILADGDRQVYAPL